MIYKNTGLRQETESGEHWHGRESRQALSHLSILKNEKTFFFEIDMMRLKIETTQPKAFQGMVWNW